jgi:hypothetical protein
MSTGLVMQLAVMHIGHTHVGSLLWCGKINMGISASANAIPS